MARNRVDGVARDLQQTIDTALPKLRAISNAAAGEPRAPGKWSRKEILGHLIADQISVHHKKRGRQKGLAFFVVAAEEVFRQ